MHTYMYFSSFTHSLGSNIFIDMIQGVQVTTTSFSGEVILYYLSNIIYTKGIVLIAMYNYIA